MTRNFNNKIQTILELNEFIYQNKKTYNYHMRHIKLVGRYAMLINHRLGANIDLVKLSYVALAHDVLKERGLCKSDDGKVFWNNHEIPQDLNKYVRKNLDTLEEFNLSDYFNTDVQLHALAAGIFLKKELGIDDPEILYPIFFHSCPIISVYETLDPKIQMMIDVITLADKLSSNYIRINEKTQFVRVDLDKVVFGESGMEFNYSLGLYIARLISQGKLPDKQSIATTEYYYKRLKDINPLISKNIGIKSLGGNKIWPKRESQALKMQQAYSKM